MLSSGRFVAAPPDGAAVFRRPDRSAPGDLATELDGDEVVEWLAEHAGATLVRACDGTVGWTAAPLVHGVMRPPLLATAAIDVDAIAAACLKKALEATKVSCPRDGKPVAVKTAICL